MIRQSAVAGQFYSVQKEELKEMLDQYLGRAKKFYEFEEGNEKRPRILVSPHAGVIFSGPVAAFSYKQIEGSSFKRVVILGASHYKWFDYAAVFPSGSFITPLGEVKVSNEAQNLVDGRSFKGDYEPHIPEHSLEMQLIFLQQVLKDFEIIPILVSQVNYDLVNKVSDELAKLLADEQTLLVVSTDLSHYPSYKVANMVDSITYEAILSGKESTFSDTLSYLDAQNLLVDTFACGHDAVSIGLKTGEKLGFKDWRYFRYRNSGDISGDLTRVVGYAALGAFSGEADYKSEALQIARRAIEFKLRTGQRLNLTPYSKRLQESGGVFVTINKRKQLRGCIGYIESEDVLSKNIVDNALSAAFNDPRFMPLTYDELDDIEIEISLLTKPALIADWQRIKLGEDGVIIEYQGRKGVFLPQVGKEKEWSLEDFLSVLCAQKVGVEPDCYLKQGAKIYTFQAEVFSE